MINSRNFAKGDSPTNKLELSSLYNDYRLHTQISWIAGDFVPNLDDGKSCAAAFGWTVINTVWSAPGLHKLSRNNFSPNEYVSISVSLIRTYSAKQLTVWEDVYRKRKSFVHHIIGAPDPLMMQYSLPLFASCPLACSVREYTHEFAEEPWPSIWKFVCIPDIWNCSSNWNKKKNEFHLIRIGRGIEHPESK